MKYYVATLLEVRHDGPDAIMVTKLYDSLDKATAFMVANGMEFNGFDWYSPEYENCVGDILETPVE
jgi:hypothetical protein